jgi:hypothetical protein
MNPSGERAGGVSQGLIHPPQVAGVFCATDSGAEIRKNACA